MTKEEAIKRLSKIKAIYLGMDNKSDVRALDMAIEALEQEPKTGHWIKENPFLISECSECGNKAFGNHGFDEVLTKYCPNCGARMVESEEEE